MTRLRELSNESRQFRTGSVSDPCFHESLPHFLTQPHPFDLSDSVKPTPRIEYFLHPDSELQIGFIAVPWSNIHPSPPPPALKNPPPLPQYTPKLPCAMPSPGCGGNSKYVRLKSCKVCGYKLPLFRESKWLYCKKYCSFCGADEKGACYEYAFRVWTCWACGFRNKGTLELSPVCQEPGRLGVGMQPCRMRLNSSCVWTWVMFNHRLGMEDFLGFDLDELKVKWELENRQVRSRAWMFRYSMVHVAIALG